MACDISAMTAFRAIDRRGRSRSEAPRLVGLDGGPALPERRPARRDVRLSCQVILGNDRTHEAVLEDVSHRGFKVRSPVSLLVGSKLELEIPNVGRVPVQVRWALGGRVGGTFLAQLAPDAFDHCAIADPAAAD
jgi:hypothetical protein